jgi:hypothetical protein
MSTNDPVKSLRSTFVSALAWITIVLTGIAIFSSLLQIVLINVLLPLPDIGAMAETARDEHEHPEFAVLLLQNLLVMPLASLVMWILILAVAIGLLKRRNWARLVYAVLMVLGILWNILGVAFMAVVLSAIPLDETAGPPEVTGRYGVAPQVVFLFSLAMAVVLSVLFGWIAKRLLSREIRSEFSRRECFR